MLYFLGSLALYLLTILVIVFVTSSYKDGVMYVSPNGLYVKVRTILEMVIDFTPEPLKQLPKLKSIYRSNREYVDSHCRTTSLCSMYWQFVAFLPVLSLALVIATIAGTILGIMLGCGSAAVGITGLALGTLEKIKGNQVPKVVRPGTYELKKHGVFFRRKVRNYVYKNYKFFKENEATLRGFSSGNILALSQMNEDGLEIIYKLYRDMYFKNNNQKASEYINDLWVAIMGFMEGVYNKPKRKQKPADVRALNAKIKLVNDEIIAAEAELKSIEYIYELVERRQRSFTYPLYLAKEKIKLFWSMIHGKMCPIVRVQEIA